MTATSGADMENGIEDSAPPQPPPHTSPTRPPKSPRNLSFTDIHYPEVQAAPSSPVKIHTPTLEVQDPTAATVEHGGIKMRSHHEATQEEWTSPSSSRPGMGERHPSSIRQVPLDGEQQHSENRKLNAAMADTTLSSPSSGKQSQYHVRNVTAPVIDSGFDFDFAPRGRSRTPPPTIYLNDLNGEIPEPQEQPQFEYAHLKMEPEKEQDDEKEPESQDQPPLTNEQRLSQRPSQGTIGSLQSASSDGHAGPSPRHSSHGSAGHQDHRLSRLNPSRPSSSLGPSPGPHNRGRSPAPSGLLRESMRPLSSRDLSASSGGRPGSARMSVMDPLNLSHSQQLAQHMFKADNAKLKGAVGTDANLLGHKKTLEMYRANVKKTTDAGVQYEFALALVSAVQQAQLSPAESESFLRDPEERKELLKEARAIMQRLSDRAYAYAQYYLADGLASGLFNNNKPDYGAAFPLFIAAGKHGHAEAAYRVALCYEFGWGTRRDLAKAVQFHRAAASKGHPGAAVRLGKACLSGEMGLHGKYREGIKWLKRATESADTQHNSAPYELGMLHVTGYGDDIFKDEEYAAKLFAQSAALGHAQANLRLGEAYEHGLLECPKDPSLSLHYYNNAAQAGIPEAMMALCAWYMVGAEPTLRKNETEAYEWARKAADFGTLPPSLLERSPGCSITMNYTLSTTS